MSKKTESSLTHFVDSDCPDLQLNPNWVRSLHKRTANFLNEQRATLGRQLQQPNTEVNQRVIIALALNEILKEIERRKVHWNEAERKALEALLERPNLSEDLRKWVRVELGYDTP